MSRTIPATPRDLAEIIATHKALFGGFTMTANPPESNPPATGEQDPPEPVKPADVTDDAWTALGDPGKKALVAERQKADTERQRADALQKQIDDAKLTADQKAAKELESAKGESAEAKSLVEKYRIAAKKGLDLQIAERLVGSTTAELEADADKLKALMGTKPGTPAPDPSQGHGGGPDGKKPVGVGAGRDLYRDNHTKQSDTNS